MPTTIAIESKDVMVFGIPTDFQHFYLVKTVTDARGKIIDERVIRGNLGTDDTVVILANVSLTSSPDARGSETPQERHRTPLDLGGRSPEDVWRLMVQHARNIDRADLPYGTGAFGVADPDEVNSNTVVASVLHAVGISLVENFPSGISPAHAPLYSRLNAMLVDDVLLGGSRGDLIFGGVGNDRLDGREGNDRLSGEAGRDVLIGGLGNDTAVGGAGDDNLLGGAGNDRLFGGAGADRLTGGSGRDSLVGNGGADRFDFNSVKESVVGAGRDVVTFVRTDRDKIDLATIDADIDGTAGNQAFKWIGSKAFSSVDGQLRFSGGILSGDLNGDSKADFEIKIVGTLIAADIIL
jgi:hypothetical protein